MESKLNHNYKSDFLRLYLIYEYGGIYVDASILPFQSFEWIIDLMNKSDKHILFYKNTQHTTDKYRPVCESWLIATNINNPIIKNLLEDFKNALKEGVMHSYKRLISDTNVNYQNFISHGPYHLVYFVMINTLTKNNLHDKIEYLDCSYSSYPCQTFTNNYKINELFLQKFTDKEFLQFCYENKFVKLTNYNRKYIKESNIHPIQTSIIGHLLR